MVNLGWKDGQDNGKSEQREQSQLWPTGKEKDPLALPTPNTTAATPPLSPQYLDYIRSHQHLIMHMAPIYFLRSWSVYVICKRWTYLYILPALYAKYYPSIPSQSHPFSPSASLCRWSHSYLSFRSTYFLDNKINGGVWMLHRRSGDIYWYFILCIY